jgi:hypothetical protein
MISRPRILKFEESLRSYPETVFTPKKSLQSSGILSPARSRVFASSFCTPRQAKNNATLSNIVALR